MKADNMAVIGEGAAHLLPILKEHFAEVVVLPSSSRLPKAVSSHPDMLISVIGGELICHIEYYNVCGDALRRIADFGGLTIRCSSCEWGEKYPLDCAFNAFVTDDAVFCRADSTANEILRVGKRSSLKTVDVKQGYAGCSSLFVNGCVITADPSIYAAAYDMYEVFHLAPGGIVLKGYEYGFIGGAGGASESAAYFFGSLSSHPMGDELRDFLLKRGVNVTEIGDAPLTDYGGIKIINRA
jgi:hypothetical protein